MRESLNAGIGVLMGVTAIVLACFAGLIARLIRRAQRGAPVDTTSESTNRLPIFDPQSTTIH